MSSSAQSRHRIVGRLRRLDDGRGAIRMEDVYATDPDDLWSALTVPERLARWVATIEGDLQPGGRIHARFTSTWEGPGRIDICDPPRHLLVTMEPGMPQEAVIEAHLSPDGDRTRLVIEERGLPLDELAGYGAGWQAHVEDLAAYLAGTVPGPWRDRWSELTPAYQELATDLR